MSPPDSRLYLITPSAIAEMPAFLAQLEEALSAGDVAALQVRLKDIPDAQIEGAVRAILPVAQKHGVAVILNDRPDLAARSGCDGVHIGQDDGTVAAARKVLPQGMIGVTCHDSRHLAMEASEQGADYVAFGAFFPTSTKQTATPPPEVETLSIWQEVMSTPCVAIGGITADNCRPLVTAGADFLAVSSYVWDHPQGPAAAVRALLAEIDAGLKARA